MAVEHPVRESDEQHEAARGVLFRLGARAAAVVFAGVLAVALSRGMDPALALLRALVALVALTACGWVAEQIARAAWRPKPDPEAEEGTRDEG